MANPSNSTTAGNDPAVNDNAPTPSPTLDLPVAIEDPRVENVVAAAMLAATAFRLRDEDALVAMLRRLTDAVDALEDDAESAPAADHAACR